MDRRRLEGLDGVPCYAVHAAPALISLIASHSAFGEPPDLVLSGVNRGANLGRAILHSGTVGAALTGGVNGGRGLAVSLEFGPDTTDPSWDVACSIAVSLVPFLLEQPLGTVLNLNVPDTDAGRVPEIREAKLARFGIVQTTMTEQDRHQIRLAVSDMAAPSEPGSDAELLGEGLRDRDGNPFRQRGCPAGRLRRERGHGCCGRCGGGATLNVRSCGPASGATAG